ncbi:MAG: class I SAM-dependent methyltransferase [Methylobacter sp.]|uniref:class I SAM-dependent methyltransferase n=1 Tax=Methylobacter sp. TaxID=2051955 RepID=UPI0027312667|nr:class I SAM-dependent methyltransferase [Methylobacter sp.]MDP1665808.1 class I SAM-dependent methyltransferase [Methylobacter sp.]MDP1971188.1 class I SAM-dependent methyltransferase [Methylobacter sp.]
MSANENGDCMNEETQTGIIPREYGQPWPDYELLDAGDGKKLERWGTVITIRPEIQANFKPGWSYAQWQDRAHWEFEEQSSTQGSWLNIKPHAPEQWLISYGNFNFGLKLTKFKHVGLFPEQQANWHFIKERVSAGQKVLNLFAYTGAASLVARGSGAEVTHVDSVRQMITWANENMERTTAEMQEVEQCMEQLPSHLSGIKWVLEDALKFAQRELKRGKQYDGIIMDPPAWGLGAKGEKWKLENHLSGLIETAYGLMNPGAFLILNTYSPKVELADLAASAGQYFSANQLEIKQLWMRTKTGKELYCGNLLRAVK